MSEVYVFNQNFELQGIIDEYVSVIWNTAYYEVGDFEIYLGASDKAIGLLKENMFVVRSSDISVVDDVTTYKKVMIVKNITINTDVENGNFLTVTGKELKYLLHSRVIWNMTTLLGNVGDCINKLIDENCINPNDSARVIPYVEVSTIPADITEAVTKQYTGEFLDVAIQELCIAYGLGYDMYATKDGNGLIKMPVEVYKGVNRSCCQNDNPYVIFTNDYDNLYNTEYILTTENYTNVALVGGEGEGTERVYTSVGTANGFERYELFVDAKDISSSDNPDIDILVVSLEAQLTAKQSEVSAKQTEINEVNTSITGTQEQITNKNTEIATKQTEINDKVFEIKNKKHEISSLKEERDYYQNKIYETNNAIAVLVVEIDRNTAKYNQAVASGNEDLAKELKEVLETQKATLLNYETILTQLNEDVINLNNTIIVLENEINTLNSELAGLTSEINNLYSEKASLQNSLNTYVSILTQKNRELKSLNDELTSITNQYNKVVNYAYADLLKEKGKETMAQNDITETFSGEVLGNVAYTLGVDYNLGDIVTVINEYGISADSRIINIIESHGEDGSITIVPTFGKWEV